MPSATGTPGGAIANLDQFLAILKDSPLNISVEEFISLLKRRQILHHQECSKATGYTLKEIVRKYSWGDVNDLIFYIEEVGQRLDLAQPLEVTVSNIIRRVLGMIRDEVEEDRDGTGSLENTQPNSPSTDSPQTPTFDDIPFLLRRAQTSRPAATATPSMFNLLAAEPEISTHNPLSRAMTGRSAISASVLQKRLIKDKDNLELKAEILTGIDEIIDEVDQAEDQIAVYGPTQIAPGENILTYSATIEVQKFFLQAAEAGRKFTIIAVDTQAMNPEAVYDKSFGPGYEQMLKNRDFAKPLIAAGIDVMFVQKSEMCALMSRTHRVIISPNAVFVNGGLLATAGTRMLAKAARTKRLAVIALCGVYKFSPNYPFDPSSLVELGNPGKVMHHRHALAHRLNVKNPLNDYIPPELVSVYITNIGPVAPSFVYKIVSDHYNIEDVNFNNPRLEV